MMLRPRVHRCLTIVVYKLKKKKKNNNYNTVIIIVLGIRFNRRRYIFSMSKRAIL